MRLGLGVEMRRVTLGGAPILANHPNTSVAAALLSLVAMMGCGGLPRGARVPVDCSELPLAPIEIRAAIEQFEPALLDADLNPTEGQVALELSDDQGSEWYLPPARDDARLRYRDDVWGPRWALWVKIACSPEAAAFIHFAREDGAPFELAPGVYPIVAVGFDVPETEQGQGSVEVDGAVTITEASGERASGYMTGWGRGRVESYLTGESLGPDFTIGAGAFRDVEAL